MAKCQEMRKVMQKCIILLILGFSLLIFCSKPKYEITLENDTYYAKAELTIGGITDIVEPQSSKVIAKLSKGNYNWKLILISTLYGDTLGTASGSINVDENKTLVVYFDIDILDYAYYWR